MSRRLLYLTQYYARPDQSGGLRHYAQTRRLLEEGYEVTLVTSFVKNSVRRIPPEYQGKRIVAEQDGDMRVFKVYGSPNYGSDFFSRMRHYLTFMLFAIVAGIRAPACDVVYASSPPLFTALGGYILSRIKRAAFVFEARDLWPQEAVVMGVLKNRAITWLAAWLARFLYRRADKIIVVTQGIREAIIREGIPASKVEVITNAVDGEIFAPTAGADGTALREDLGWAGKFVALYAGTLARSDSLETLVQAARYVAGDRDIMIAFLGEGEARPSLVRLTEELGLSNVSFLEARPKDEVPLYIRAADVCLLPTRGDSFFGMVLPNKLFDYLAAGAPVIASVPKGETQDLLEKASAGIVVEPENAEALAEALTRLRATPDTLRVMGGNGRAYVIERYDRQTTTGTLVNAVNGVFDYHQRNTRPSLPRPVSSARRVAGLAAAAVLMFFVPNLMLGHCAMQASGGPLETPEAVEESQATGAEEKRRLRSSSRTAASAHRQSVRSHAFWETLRAHISYRQIFCVPPHPEAVLATAFAMGSAGGGRL